MLCKNILKFISLLRLKSLPGMGWWGDKEWSWSVLYFLNLFLPTCCMTNTGPRDEWNKEGPGSIAVCHHLSSHIFSLADLLTEMERGNENNSSFSISLSVRLGISWILDITLLYYFVFIIFFSFSGTLIKLK